MTKKNPWLICAAGTLLLCCTVGLSVSSFSVFQPYLIRDIGLTNSESSLFLTVRTLSGLCAAFPVQAYLGKVGLRRGTAPAFIILTVFGVISTVLIFIVYRDIPFGPKKK